MNGFGAFWSGLSAGRKMVVVLATLGVFAALMMLSRGAATRDMSLLYASLEAGAAGDVITALEQRGVPFEVRGTAIWVPVTQRDELRLTLASEGLPANTGQGYELLDGLSGFGTTSQMFDAAYWRAKEGELARTILASPHIRAARVHISSPVSRPFQRETAITAAVTVTTAGGTLSGPQARALRYLVASSVSGLLPENVAVIDGQGGLIDLGDDMGSGAGQPLTAELRARAERLLEARVGVGNAIVEVSIDTVTESESIIERLIDPESRVAISTEVDERTNSTTDTAGGDVTVASNLPTGDGAGDGSSASDDSETRSITNYEVSETNREVLRAPGAVRRLTVAVLVNDVVSTDASGVTTSTPRAPEELQAMSELVASAVGIDPARGDVITIRSLSFEPLQVLGTEALAGEGGSPLDMMSLIQLGVLALVALVLGLFVVRPILAANRIELSDPEISGLIGTNASGASTGADITSPGKDDFGQLPSLPDFGNGMTGGDDFAMDSLGGDGPIMGSEDPVSRLRRMIDERQDETIQILQSWIEDPDDAERA